MEPTRRIPGVPDAALIKAIEKTSGLAPNCAEASVYWELKDGKKNHDLKEWRQNHRSR